MLNMAVEFLDIPVEMQEKVLSKLNNQALLIASEVCKLWLTVCARISKKRFGKVIPPECIAEIENASADETWMLAARNHILEQCLVSNMLNHKLLEPQLKIKNNFDLCYASYGNLIFIGNIVGQVLVYNTTQSSFDKPVVLTGENVTAVLQLVVLPLQHILVVIKNKGLEFWNLPLEKYIETASDKDLNINILLHVFENYNGPIDYRKNISAYNHHLVAVTDLGEVSLFRIHHEQDGGIVIISLLHQFLTEASVNQVSIWRNLILMLLNTGEVTVWNIITQESTISQRYQEIQYMNPAWVVRGQIFCSTMISSQMLGYWHMDRGSSYWLIGRPDSELVRCRDLGTMFSADTNIEDVLCICVKQRILACGTKDGKILLYYLSNSYFSFENNEDFEEESNNRFVRTEFDRVPDLTIRTTQRPIKDISVVFLQGAIHIYTWPYMSSSGVGSTGCFNCVVLQEGDWVTQEERDSL